MNFASLPLNGFNQLLDLSCIPFPPAEPQPHTQWMSNVPVTFPRRHFPALASGWLLHIPGFMAPRFFYDKERADNYHRYLTQLLRASSYLGVGWDGDLIDYRTDVPRVVRRDYAQPFSSIRNGRELVSTLRFIERHPERASHYLITAAEGVLCPDCVKEELDGVIVALRYSGDDYEWRVTGWRVHSNAPLDSLTCDNCCKCIAPTSS